MKLTKPAAVFIQLIGVFLLLTGCVCVAFYDTWAGMIIPGVLGIICLIIGHPNQKKKDTDDIDDFLKTVQEQRKINSLQRNPIRSVNRK